MRKINLFIDGLFFECSGIGRCYEFLIKELPKREEVEKIYTTINIAKKKNFEEKIKNDQKIIPIYLNYKYFSPQEFFSKGKVLKELESKVDLFHFLQVNLPLYLPKKFTVTIHDLEPLQRKNAFLKRKVFKFYFQRALKKTTKIITVSNTTKKEILKIQSGVEEKIKIIYPSIDEKFLETKKETKRLVSDKYILYVGNRKEHKNLGNLIRAFKIVKEKYQNLKLVIAGNRFVEKDEVDILKKELHLENEIIEFVSPSDKEIINLYLNAEILVLPSFYEGFGLTPLEAISCDCSAITSNIPVLKEVLGEKIACFNPYSVEDIAEKISSVLEDENKKKELLSIGKERLKNFDKEKIIEEYLKYFKEIIENENSSIW